MRISDWSSDVCSSDLFVLPDRFGMDIGFVGQVHQIVDDEAMIAGEREMLARLRPLGACEPRQVGKLRGVRRLFADPDPEDRKSDVEGKSVSVRVDLGGRRIIKKKKTKKTIEAR